MATQLVVIAYLVLASFTAVYVFYHGVVRRPWSPLFGSDERAALVLACIAVGVFWILFTPVLAALAVRRVPTGGRHLRRIGSTSPVAPIRVRG